MSNDTIKTSKWYFSTADAIFDVEGLDIHDQTIYILLCAHADRDGKSFPAYATLAKRGRMSERKAKYCVAKLVEMGLIRKKPRQKDNGGDSSNEYTIVDAYDFLANIERSAHSAHGGMHVMHGGSAHSAPKHNHLSLPFLTDDDKRNQSIEFIYQKYKKEIPRERFDIVVQRVTTRKASNFEALLDTSVQREIANMQVASSHTDVIQPRRNRTTSNRKPKIDIVKDSDQAPAEIPPEKLEQMRKLARKLDKKG
ncbi:helix-turn-helix domain-containing protein [Paenibacillus sp. MMO-177]|uniref:helix-turn-helix domain-containing protein n=1 Tax=Paenibacillus sp. MMO-177 TaxID=3081289 RepID=UPI00301B2433